MIFVFDTNILKQSLYLHSPSGAAVRFFLRQQGARVAVPEVVRLEVENHLRTDITEMIEEIAKNHHSLLFMFGRLKEVVLPSEGEIEAKVKSAFRDLGVEIIDVPFSLESARNSLMKIIMKEKPSEKSQQFKDGVIWADCLKLAEIDDVTLVTNDKAFFKGHDTANGLAKNLLAEASRLNHKISIYSSLEEALKDVRVVGVDIPENLLLEGIFMKWPNSRKMLEDNEFELGDKISVKYKLFVTEVPIRLFLSFEVVMGCHDVSGGDRNPASITVNGEADFITNERVFSRIMISREVLSFKVEGEENKEFIACYGASHIDLGHRSVRNIIRYSLESDQQS
jgi:hypothetical protein